MISKPTQSPTENRVFCYLQSLRITGGSLGFVFIVTLALASVSVHAAKRELPAWCQGILTTAGSNPNSSSDSTSFPEAREEHRRQLEAAVTRWLYNIGFVDTLLPETLTQKSDFLDFLKAQSITYSTLSSSEKNKWVSEFFAEKWAEWTDLTVRNRENLMALELRQLGYRSGPAAVSLASRQILPEISAENLRRWRQFFANELMQYKKLSEKDSAEIENVARQLKLALVRKQIGQGKQQQRTPLITESDLESLNLNLRPSFFHSLVGDLHSVIFKVEPVVQESDGRALIPYSPGQFVVQVPMAWAGEIGYAAPNLEEAHDLFTLAVNHFPAVTNQFLADMRWHLPPSKQTVESLSAMMRFEFNQLFPQRSIESKMAGLRSQLVHTVLSASDLEAFMKEALVSYLHHLNNSNRKDFNFILKTLRSSAGIQKTFTERVYPWLGLPSGMAFHIPGSVSAEQFLSSRLDEPSSRVARVHPYVRATPRPALPPTHRMDPDR